jgi:putative flippase GtrA
MRGVPRFARYTGVSLIATALAQVGQAFGYGYMRWPVAPSVLFSLAVSAVPAYLLSRRYVWPDKANPRAAAGEATGFLVVALIGAGITIAVVWAAVQIAGTVTSGHVTLSVVANAANLLSTGLVWVARYFVLDRVLFAQRPIESAVAPASSVPA